MRHYALTLFLLGIAVGIVGTLLWQAFKGQVSLGDELVHTSY